MLFGALSMFTVQVLALPALRPLSRLSYTAYLIHPLIILLNYQVPHPSYHSSSTLTYQAREVALHASLPTLSALYVSHLTLSYGAALLYSLIFEAPFINMQKVIGF